MSLEKKRLMLEKLDIFSGSSLNSHIRQVLDKFKINSKCKKCMHKFYTSLLNTGAGRSIKMF